MYSGGLADAERNADSIDFLGQSRIVGRRQEAMLRRPGRREPLLSVNDVDSKVGWIAIRSVENKKSSKREGVNEVGSRALPQPASASKELR